MTRRSAFIAGCIAISPVMLGVVPFGLLVGLASAEAGYGVVGALGFSVIIYAGASQLAVISILSTTGSIVVAITTALVINSRLVMYSAALAPQLRNEPFWLRALSSYCITDQAFGITMPRIRAGELTPQTKLPFLGGAIVVSWIAWQTTTVLGVVFGDFIPEWIPISFAVPLAFIGILRPNITDRPALVAALVAGFISVVGTGLPANAGLPLGAVCGIAIGTWLAHRK